MSKGDNQGSAARKLDYLVMCAGNLSGSFPPALCSAGVRVWGESGTEPTIILLSKARVSFPFHGPPAANTGSSTSVMGQMWQWERSKGFNLK